MSHGSALPLSYPGWWLQYIAFQKLKCHKLDSGVHLYLWPSSCIYFYSSFILFNSFYALFLSSSYAPTHPVTSYLPLALLTRRLHDSVAASHCFVPLEREGGHTVLSVRRPNGPEFPKCAAQQGQLIYAEPPAHPAAYRSFPSTPTYSIQPRPPPDAPSAVCSAYDACFGPWHS